MLTKPTTTDPMAGENCNVGTTVLLTVPIAATAEHEFLPVCARGIIIAREFNRPRVAFKGCVLLLFDKEIRKSPW